jgi:hypothetical protein
MTSKPRTRNAMHTYERERSRREPAEDEAQEPNRAICAWCGNKNQEVCVERCQAERQYRYLEPATLHDWELPPELPPFRVLMALPAIERLALIYLTAAYMQRAAERGA